MLNMLFATGMVPTTQRDGVEYGSFHDIRSKADRPVVIFPECTTSNGRGLLRFSNVFPPLSLPIKQFQVFVMCVRWVAF